MAMLIVGLLLVATADEEAAMQRMLTLHQRSLVSDRPLPVVPLPGASAAQSVNASDTCTAAAHNADAHGHPTTISPWAATFATREHTQAFSPVPSDFGLEKPFAATVQALHDGEFKTARSSLHRLCLHGQALAQAMQDEPHRLPPRLATTATVSEAAILARWVTDECSLLLQYMPESPPNREDHKRLMMLLHDLGGSAMLLHLLGVLGASWIPVEPMATLGEYLGASFGEWNRRTAVSRALGMAVRSADAQGDAVGVLQEYGLCTPPPPMDSSTGGTDETNDMWADVGVRACATLLLRRGQIGAALDLLKAIVTPAQSLHAFLTAFELASRLLPTTTTPAPARPRPARAATRQPTRAPHSPRHTRPSPPPQTPTP